MILRKEKRHRGFITYCKCDYCGKEFKRRLSITKNYKNNYCNLDCKNKDNIGYRHSEETKRKISEANKDNKNCLGRILSEETKRKIGKKAKERLKNPENNPSWKGGKTKRRGYILIKSNNHPYCDKHGYVQEHRLVMEQSLGRYLKPEEEIHHINGIKDDNRIENLMLFENKSKHMKYEAKLKKNNPK